MLTVKQQRKLNAINWHYSIYPCLEISQVDKFRRDILKITKKKYIGMVNHNDIYLLIFRQKKDE